jgi:hypothetical protein
MDRSPDFKPQFHPNKKFFTPLYDLAASVGQEKEVGQAISLCLQDAYDWCVV